MSEDTKKRRAPGKTTEAGCEGFRSLLVPVDLTPVSDRVLARLAHLPLAEDARVTLLHVVPGSIHARDRPAAESDANKALAAELRHLRKSLPRSVTLEAIVRVGAPAKEIAAAASRVKAELIVVGRGGGRALRDAFLGSTAERIVRRAQLPVLVVRLPGRSVYQRPALALDLDDAAHDVVRVLLRMLPSPRPSVAVIHAFHAPYQSLVYPSLAGEEADTRKDELQLRVAGKLRALLSTALAEAEVPPGEAPFWRVQVRHGSPRLVVEKALARSESDLLVVGTHGYSGAAYVLLGTVAGDLLREARCDVLVVPPRARK
jgi:nucleotide-binding universal stress UspA family protein